MKWSRNLWRRRTLLSKRAALIALMSTVSLLLLTACTNRQGAPLPDQSYGEQEPTQQMAIGDVFLNSNLKIKTTVVDNSFDPVREGVFELYVDANGNGSGMFGLGELLCDVKAVSNNLYLVIDGTNVVAIADLTPRMIWSGTQVAGASNLVDLGFTLVGDSPTGYTAKQGPIVITSKYASSTQTFEPSNLTASNTMSLQDAMGYLIDYYADASGEIQDVPEGEDEEVQSFYISSKYGVKIDGTVYSVGDTCNPSTYFGSVPEGLLSSSSYREDVRVDFLHASYISETGRSVFTLAGDYVQSIETTADFEWLGFSKGALLKDVQKKLGYKLSKKELETYVPIDEEVVVESSGNNKLVCTVGQLRVELRFDSSGLASIYVERMLAYK